MESESRDRLQWQHICRILDQVLDTPVDERARILEAASREDASLREELEALLALEETSETILGDTVLDLVEDSGEPVLFEDDGLPAGQTVGVYRVVEPAGPPGGMGRVYRVVRDDVGAEYALKVLHPMLSDVVFLRWFEEERRILARFQDQIHIARFVDAGLIDDGVPYVVMDFVHGSRIDEYCDRHLLDISARLQLFLDVCSAIQYAHSQLVVHCDLKPSNILVSEDGVVKVVDFGIARLLDGAIPSLVTGAIAAGEEPLPAPSIPSPRKGGFLTWAYASPEQVRGEDSTPATDVYALGIVLYELLTGRRPYEVTGATPESRAAVVLTHASLPPSEAVHASPTDSRQNRADRHEDPSEVARLRSTTPEGLERQLRGDLDAILLKALEKDVPRRYISVEQFAQDLRRHLASEPVTAVPRTARYVAGRFARRYRRGLAITSAVMLALLAITGYALLQERKATREAQRAAAVTTFLVDILYEANPWDEDPGDVSVRTVLARGAQRVRAQLKDQPETQADLHHVLGAIYRKIGPADSARVHIDAALSLRTSLLGASHPDIAASLFESAMLAQEAGRYPQAESLHLATQKILYEHFEEDSEEVAEALNGFGLLRQGQGQVDEAEQLYRQSLRIRNMAPERDDAKIAGVQNNLATVLYEKQKYSEAESLYQVVYAAQKRHHGPEHPYVAVTIGNLGLLKQDQGDYEEAEAYYRESLRMRQAFLEPTHPQVEAVKNNMATLYFMKGDLDAAEQLFRELLDARLARHAEPHPDLVYALNNMASVLKAKEDYQGALPLARETLRVLRALVEDEHPSIPMALSNLGSVYGGLGELATADSLYQQSLELRRKALGPEHSSVAVDLVGLALVRQKKGELSEAEGRFREALSILRKHFPEDHPDVAVATRYLADLLQERDRDEEAETLYERALSTNRAVLSSVHPELARVLRGLGQLRLKKGDAAAAEPLLREALRIQQTKFGDRHVQTATTQSLLGACLTDLARYEEADSLLRIALVTLDEQRGYHHEETRKARQRLAALGRASR